MPFQHKRHQCSEISVLKRVCLMRSSSLNPWFKTERFVTQTAGKRDLATYYCNILQCANHFNRCDTLSAWNHGSSHKATQPQKNRAYTNRSPPSYRFVRSVHWCAAKKSKGSAEASHPNPSARQSYTSHNARTRFPSKTVFLSIQNHL